MGFYFLWDEAESQLILLMRRVTGLDVQYFYRHIRLGLGYMYMHSPLAKVKMQGLSLMFPY